MLKYINLFESFLNENTGDNSELIFNFWPFASEDMKNEYPGYPATMTISELTEKYEGKANESMEDYVFSKTEGGKGFYISGERNPNGFVLLVTKGAHPLRFEVTSWSSDYKMLCRTASDTSYGDLANANVQMVNGTVYSLSKNIKECPKLYSYLSGYKDGGDDFEVRSSLGEYFD